MIEAILKKNTMQMLKKYFANVEKILCQCCKNTLQMLKKILRKFWKNTLH